MSGDSTLQFRSKARGHRSISSLVTTLHVMLTLCIVLHPQRASAQGNGVAADVQGEIEVQYEDGPRSARLLHYLRTDNGERLRLQFLDQAPELLTGSRVRARGTRQGNTLMLSSSSTSLTTQSLASSSTFGPQSVLVILINFTDNTATPYDKAAASDVTFNQTSNFYLENSYNQTSLTGTVVGWFNIAASSTTCDNNNWATLADQAASNAGVQLSQYSRRVYGFPQTNACAWWGLSTVGGNPSRSWINGSYELRVVAHELGHAFGDYHSHSQPCDPAGCTSVEYGDDHDTMGGYTAHMNAFQKERLGWLNYGSSPAIQTVTATGDYFVANYESGTAGPKALKIWNPNTSTYYYVEQRAGLGFDSGVAPGVVMHTGSPTVANSSYQVDLDPMSSGFSSILGVGQMFSDNNLGLHVTTVTTSTDGALMHLDFGSATCNAASPNVSLAPSYQVAAPGYPASYTVSVTNNDSAACSPASFNISAAVPAGWSASAPGISSLSPGASGSITLSATAPSGSLGTFTFPVTAANSNSGYYASAPAYLDVTNTLAVSTTATASGSKGSRSVAVNVSVGADSMTVAGASVTVTLTSPTGVVKTTTTTTTSEGTAYVKYSLRAKDPSGTYTLKVVATKGSLTGSSSTTVTVP